jgi:DnaJ-class molecular chaperone
MRTRRIRAILKAKGYKKKKDVYAKPCKCFKCKGTGTWAGWVSNGTYPHVDTWYQEPDTCPDCKGTGKEMDVTCIQLERA